MKNTKQIILAFLLAVTNLLALGCGKPSSESPLLWVRQFGSVGDFDDVATAVSQTGDIYLCGYTSGLFTGQTDQGIQDAFISCFDSNGKERWIRQFSSKPDTYAKAIAADAQGIYIGGYTTGAFAGQSNAGLIDAFVARLDLQGNIVWVRQFGGVGDDYAYAISINTGGIYVAGVTYDSLPGQPLIGGSDAFICKYSFDGDNLWIRQLGSKENDYCYGVYADDSGVYAVGTTYGAFPGQVNAGGSDGFIQAYDNGGTALWARQLGTAANDYLNAIAGENGDLYVTGVTYGEFPSQLNAGGADFFVSRLNSKGEVAWISEAGSPSTDFAWACSAQNGIQVTGYTAGALAGKNKGGYDAYSARFGTDGKLTGIEQFGTSQDDYAKGILAGPGGAYICGATRGRFVGGGSPNGTREDAFIARISFE